MNKDKIKIEKNKFFQKLEMMLIIGILLFGLFVTKLIVKGGKK